MRQWAVTAAAGAAQQIGAAVQPCSRAARQLRRSRRGVVRRWRGRRQQWRGAALATAAAETAATGECHRRRARPPCCWTPTTRLALDQTISAGSANFFIEADRPGQRGASTVSRTWTERRTCAPSGGQHEGGVLAGLHLQRRIELVKKRQGGDSDCHCVHTCLASLKKRRRHRARLLHARPS